MYERNHRFHGLHGFQSRVLWNMVDFTDYYGNTTVGFDNLTI